MPRLEPLRDLAPEVRAHLVNVADNLQLVADMAYGDVALAVPEAGCIRLPAGGG
jgi:hypothetical protein